MESNMEVLDDCPESSTTEQEHLAELAKSARTTTVTTSLPAMTKAEWHKLEFKIDISFPHDDEDEETKGVNSLHSDAFDSSDEAIRAQARDKDNAHTIPLSERPRTFNIHEMVDQLIQPTTAREQNQRQILLKLIKHYLDTRLRVRPFRGNSEGSSRQSAGMDGDSRKDKVIAIVDIVAEGDDSYEVDEHFYTTEEWLKLANFVETTRLAMTRELEGTDSSEETYSYRAHYDGTNDEILDLRFAKPKLSLRKPLVSHNSEEEGEWNRAEMLHHSDRTRHIISCHSISDKDIQPAAIILARLLELEGNPQRMVALDIIAYTRLDRLIEAIINEQEETTLTLSFEKVLMDAIDLQDRWKARFGARYSRIDEKRLLHLRTCGAFHDVVVNRYSDDEKTMFIVKRCMPTGTYIEMDNRYKPGDWWLNIACAYRDGIAGSQFEILSNCRYGVLTLALLDGNEDPGDNRTSSYSTKGRFDCIPLELIKLNNGKPLRLLRGCGLSSIWAPKGGVRYDGLYTLKTFGTRYHGGNVWTWTLTLQQIDREPDVVDLLCIPSPSQFDDWELCNKMVEATLEGAREDVARIAALRERVLTDEWDRELSRISRRLSDVM